MPNARRGVSLLLFGLLTACGGEPANDEAETEPPVSSLFASAEQSAFWESLEAMCGQAFLGTLVENEPPSADFEGQALVMHVRECSDDEIRVPFFVGEDRSRTWVFTPSMDGQAMRLKHDHRHEDGTEDEVTQYGGDTADFGTATRQSFPADAFTAELVPAASTNVWTVELIPGELFAYRLRREGTDRRFRVEFDLSQPTEVPPPPWGSD
ncbi:MAG: hypothetical protein KJO11_01755 [Gemmatimonadetes bacterium]|nr:hypothetical protein [Gemmatimonadota bacterium]NNF38703.1 hypothetical protein [Gemmatimonadota bacterium]NNK63130.1 hypothetical protein [Gemmatimonadota bacterium]